MSLVNLESYPGKTTKAEIILEGTDPGDRTGFWYTHYKKIDGDSEKMDITSWITIEPKDFTIKEGEKQVFAVEIKIPRNAEPGLWGATSEEAGKEGHSDERRTYLIFKDAPAGGNVYSGLLIPISVKILPSINPLTPIINFIKQNIMVIVLSIIIIVMGIFFLKNKKRSIENKKRILENKKISLENKKRRKVN
ncbi:MAG: hypothetical protein WDK96_02785 [Candidatus Paceibacterota bacterium]|jgi:hypothetical protein